MTRGRSEGSEMNQHPSMVRVWVGALEIGDRSCVGADGRYGVDLDQRHHLPPWFEGGVTSQDISHREDASAADTRR